MGLVLVQSFVKVVRQTYATSAKQKFLIWNFLLCQCYDTEYFFFLLHGSSMTTHLVFGILLIFLTVSFWEEVFSLQLPEYPR